MSFFLYFGKFLACKIIYVEISVFFSKEFRDYLERKDQRYPCKVINILKTMEMSVSITICIIRFLEFLENMFVKMM